MNMQRRFFSSRIFFPRRNLRGTSRRFEKRFEEVKQNGEGCHEGDRLPRTELDFRRRAEIEERCHEDGSGADRAPARRIETGIKEDERA